MLNTIITKEEFDRMPEAIQEHYKLDAEDANSYMLESNDETATNKLNEFRTNNIKYLKRAEELAANLEKFKGIDPIAYKKTLEDLQDMKDKKLLKAGDVDAIVEEKTERMRADLEGKNTILQELLDKEKEVSAKKSSHLSILLIDSGIQNAASKVGVPRKGAMGDIIGRARKVFVIQDGIPIPMKDDKVLYGADGKNVMTMEEWTEGLLEEAPHLFTGSKGGGAGGSEENKSKGGLDTIQADDKEAFGKNLADIASGKKKVVAAS